MILVARTAGAPEKMFHAIQTEVAALDPEIPMFDVKTLEEHIGVSLFLQHMAATVLSIFGLLALSLATVGLCGVMAYTVAQRTRELGIRVSVGAKQSDILKLILGQGLMLTAIGMIGGLVTALAVTRPFGWFVVWSERGRSHDVYSRRTDIAWRRVDCRILSCTACDQGRPNDCPANGITRVLAKNDERKTGVPSPDSPELSI
jgi:FtsX-like permease family